MKKNFSISEFVSEGNDLRVAMSGIMNLQTIRCATDGVKLYMERYQVSDGDKFKITESSVKESADPSIVYPNMAPVLPGFVVRLKDIKASTLLRQLEAHRKDVRKLIQTMQQDCKERNKEPLLKIYQDKEYGVIFRTKDENGNSGSVMYPCHAVELICRAAIAMGTEDLCISSTRYTPYGPMLAVTDNAVAMIMHMAGDESVVENNLWRYTSKDNEADLFIDCQGEVESFRTEILSSYSTEYDQHLAGALTAKMQDYHEKILDKDWQQAARLAGVKCYTPRVMKEALKDTKTSFVRRLGGHANISDVEVYDKIALQRAQEAVKARQASGVVKKVA